MRPDRAAPARGRSDLRARAAVPELVRVRSRAGDRSTERGSERRCRPRAGIRIPPDRRGDRSEAQTDLPIAVGCASGADELHPRRRRRGPGGLRASYGGDQQLLPGTGGRHRAIDLRVPHARSRLVRHRLQLLDRQVRTRVRGSLGRRHRTRDRGRTARLQHPRVLRVADGDLQQASPVGRDHADAPQAARVATRRGAPEPPRTRGTDVGGGRQHPLPRRRGGQPARDHGASTDGLHGLSRLQGREADPHGSPIGRTDRPAEDLQAPSGADGGHLRVLADPDPRRRVSVVALERVGARRGRLRAVRVP